MFVTLIVAAVACFILSFFLILYGGKCLVPRPSESFFEKNDRVGKSGSSLILGLGFLVVGMVLVSALSFDGGQGTLASARKALSKAIQENEPHRTVFTLEANEGHIIFVCKMYDVKTETGEPKENDCASVKNLTAYLMNEPTPPIFMKTKGGEYKELSPEEASFIKSLR